MRGYQRIAWIGNVLPSSCPDCGGAVSNRERHDAWHAASAADESVSVVATPQEQP